MIDLRTATLIRHVGEDVMVRTGMVTRQRARLLFVDNYRQQALVRLWRSGRCLTVGQSDVFAMPPGYDAPPLLDGSATGATGVPLG